MTTVVIDFKNKKVVADKQATITKCKSSFIMGTPELLDWTFDMESVSKVFRCGNTVVVGAGDLNEVNRQRVNWTNKRYVDKPKADCTIAVVYNKGDGLLVDLYKAVNTLFGYKWEKSLVQGNSTVITFGSGSNYAYGAFMGGLSAEESVVAASKCDKYTSCEYDVMVMGE